MQHVAPDFHQLLPPHIHLLLLLLQPLLQPLLWLVVSPAQLQQSQQ
jgi:hypothetical protein